jgi:hypothetical protein
VIGINAIVKIVIAPTKNTMRVDMRPGQLRDPNAIPPSKLPMPHTAIKVPAAPFPASFRAVAMTETSTAANPITMAKVAHTRIRTPTERSAA